MQICPIPQWARIDLSLQYMAACYFIQLIQSVWCAATFVFFLGLGLFGSVAFWFRSVGSECEQAVPALLSVKLPWISKGLRSIFEKYPVYSGKTKDPLHLNPYLCLYTWCKFHHHPSPWGLRWTLLQTCMCSPKICVCIYLFTLNRDTGPIQYTVYQRSYSTVTDRMMWRRSAEEDVRIF